MRGLITLITGVLLGGAAALLYDPESGTINKDRVKKYADGLKKEFDKQKEVSFQKVNDWKENGAEKMADLKNTTEELVENAAKKVNHSI